MRNLLKKISEENKKKVFYIISICICILAFLPGKLIPDFFYLFSSSNKHVFSFLVISILLNIIYKIKIQSIFLIVILFGISIEIIQGLFTTREFSFSDFIYDIIGFIVFLIIKKILDILKII